MTRLSLRTLVLLLAISAPVIAAAPNTLGYQGRLATSGGLPVSATLSITFRIYDVASGGVALWTETQGTVAVDGGNLAVELGSVTPLPTTIWGRKLYLGVQVAGDSEMLPRPALSASPYALRAAGTMKNTVVVSAEGTPTENGTALLAAVAGISGASASNQVTVDVDSGNFDLGTAQLLIPSFVTIAGRSRDTTLITSATLLGTLRLSSNTEARDLTATNTGNTASQSFPNQFGIGAYVDGNLPVTNVRLNRVTGKSVAPPGGGSIRQGIYLCAGQARLTDVIGIGDGGDFSFGMRADCATTNGGNFIDGMKLFASNATAGVRGAYLAGGGPWKDIVAFVTVSPTADSAYGIRVFPNNATFGSVLLNPFVNISPDVDYQQSTSVAPLVTGIRIDRAETPIIGGIVNIDRVSSQILRGIHWIAIPGDNQADIRGTNVRLVAVGQASYGDAEAIGVLLSSAGGRVADVQARLNCVAGSIGTCVGIGRRPAFISNVEQAMQGTLAVTGADVLVTQDNPAASGRSYGMDFQGGDSDIANSKVRTVQNTVPEATRAMNVNDNTIVRANNNVIEADGPSVPNGGCAVALGATASVGSFYGDNFVGGVCAGTATCAGNTKRGGGFLTSTCP